MNKLRSYFGLALFMFVIGVILTRIGLQERTFTTTTVAQPNVNIHLGYTTMNIYPTLWAYIGIAVLPLSIAVFLFALLQSRKQTRR